MREPRGGAGHILTNLVATIWCAADVFQEKRVIGDLIRFYNSERPHTALDV
jgi:hypothetical protein